MRKTINGLVAAGVLLLTSHIAFAQSYVTDKVVVGVYDIASTDGSLLKVLPTGTPLETLQTSDGFTQIRTPDGLTGWIETAYIIDNKPAQLLVLELTDKHRQAEAQLDDARKQLLDMQERMASLQAKPEPADKAELDKLKNKNRKLRNKIGEMDQELKKARGSIQADKSQREQLDKEITSLRKQLQEAKKAPTQPATAVPAAVSNNPGEESLAKLKNENAAMQKQLDAIYQALSMTAPSKTDSEEAGIKIQISWLIASLAILLLAGLAIGWKLFDWLNVKRHGGFRL